MKLFNFQRANKNEIERNQEENVTKESGDSFVTLLHELIDGPKYSFGEPWQLTTGSLSAVVPIRIESFGSREYTVLQEIPTSKLTITDSGRIHEIDAKVKDVSLPIFVRGGTIFKGEGTQSRTSEMGIVLEPEKETIINAFCVHASHGISRSSGFAMGDVVPRKVEDVLLSPKRSQSIVWNQVSRGSPANVSQCPRCRSARLLQNYEAELVCTDCGNTIPPLSLRAFDRMSSADALRLRRWETRIGMYIRSDSLVRNLEEMSRFNQKVEDILSKVPADLENQVGIVIIDSGGILGLEMFDHPDSWRAFSKSLVRNYADMLAKDRAGGSLFTLNTENIISAIRSFLCKAQGQTRTVGFKNSICETEMLSGELLGEYTTMKSKLIHLLLKRKMPP